MTIGTVKVSTKMPAGWVRPTFSKAVVVRAGYVWEHDVNADGLATSVLRPHYAEGAHGWPAGGYPDPKDLPRLEAEARAAAPTPTDPA